MDKKNYWVIALMVALAVGLLAAVTLLRPSGGQNGEIVVTVDGAEYARVPLGQKQTLTVTQEDGSVNAISPESTAVFFIPSPPIPHLPDWADR